MDLEWYFFSSPITGYNAYECQGVYCYNQLTWAEGDEFCIERRGHDVTYTLNGSEVFYYMDPDQDSLWLDTAFGGSDTAIGSSTVDISVCPPCESLGYFFVNTPYHAPYSTNSQPFAGVRPFDGDFEFCVVVGYELQGLLAKIGLSAEYDILLPTSPSHAGARSSRELRLTVRQPLC